MLGKHKSYQHLTHTCITDDTPGPGTVLSDILHSQVPGEGLNLGTAFSVLQIPLPPKLSQVTRLASGQRLSPEVMLVLPPLLILLPPLPGLASSFSPSWALNPQRLRDVRMQLIKVIEEVRQRPTEDKGCGSLFYTCAPHIPTPRNRDPCMHMPHTCLVIFTCICTIQRSCPQQPTGQKAADRVNAQPLIPVWP